MGGRTEKREQRLRQTNQKTQAQYNINDPQLETVQKNKLAQLYLMDDMDARNGHSGLMSQLLEQECTVEKEIEVPRFSGKRKIQKTRKWENEKKNKMTLATDYSRTNEKIQGNILFIYPSTTCIHRPSNKDVMAEVHK